MAKLINDAELKRLPASAFIFPEEREYPLIDRGHAYDALRMAEQETPDRASKIRSSVLERFNIGRSGATIR